MVEFAVSCLKSDGWSITCTDGLQCRRHSTPMWTASVRHGVQSPARHCCLLTQAGTLRQKQGTSLLATAVNRGVVPLASFFGYAVGSGRNSCPVQAGRRYQ